METTSRYQFDPSTLKASEKEFKAHRLTNFNEKIQLLLSKVLANRSFEEIDAIKNMAKDEKYIAPHLAVGLGVVRPVVLTCGDPFRSKVIAEMCDTHTEVAWNREYRMYNVTYEGANMTIVSHGIGGPGAAICFEELIKLGATTIIRLGTCGSLKPNEIKQGQLIVSTSACREDGHSSWMVPSGFPAVADPRVALALYDQAKTLGYQVHMGVTLTSGNFYPGPAMPSTLQVNADAGALSVEMENATLFCVGSVRGIRTGAIATIDGSPFNWEDGDYDPHGKTVAEGKIRMITTGLKVAKKIVSEGQVEQKKAENPKEIFNDDLTNSYISIFKEKNLFDHIIGMDNLKNGQKAKIYQLASDGIYSDFQFYLANGTELDEEEVKKIIVLFYKVQRDLDPEFRPKATKFCQADEAEGPTN